MWNIYGKQYDLTNYMDSHPGGRFILQRTQGLDVTAMFETYHAFSNIDKIRKQLANYEVSTQEVEPFDFTNYHKLVKEIKTLFPDRKSIKAPAAFFVQMGWMSIYLAVTFYCTYFSHVSFFWSCITQMMYSIGESSVMFNLLHDGSHYGVFLDPALNQWTSKVVNNIVVWNANAWFYHHVYMHHSVTGLENDPDALLYSFPAFYQCVAFYTLFPGQQFGQAFLYSLIPFTGKYGSTKVPPIHYDLMDLFFIVFKLYCFYRAGFVQFLIHACIVNTLYYINIYPNHSFYETKENKYTGNDWAKMQIMHSGNFVNSNVWWTRIFGGINYQIEHHLFPNMSNVHYPCVAGIVKKYCLKNDIPYVHHGSLYAAFLSFAKYVNGKT